MSLGWTLSLDKMKGSARKVALPSQRKAALIVCVCMSAHACVHMHVHVCAHVRVCVCVSRNFCPFKETQQLLRVPLLEGAGICHFSGDPSLKN